MALVRTSAPLGESAAQVLTGEGTHKVRRERQSGRAERRRGVRARGDRIEGEVWLV